MRSPQVIIRQLLDHIPLEEGGFRRALHEHVADWQKQSHLIEQDMNVLSRQEGREKRVKRWWIQLTVICNRWLPKPEELDGWQLEVVRIILDNPSYNPHRPENGQAD